MSKLTNKLMLPAPLVEAIRNSGYDSGASDITATGLIEPARIGALKKKYAEELTEDASDLIYSLQGQSIHTILERAAGALKEEGYIAEQRFYAMFGGWNVGAQIDIFHRPTGLLQDYKVTSVYSVKDGAKAEYTQQMNVQAEILRQNGHPVSKLQIVAILRDWTKGERQRDVQQFGASAKYPPHQITILDIPLLPSSETIAWIEARVEAHRAARGGDLPECTPEERWAREDKWAVMKKGLTRASKLCSTEQDAENLAKVLGGYVEPRPGVNTRCESYCPVSKFCSQYQKMKAEREGK